MDAPPKPAEGAPPNHIPYGAPFSYNIPPSVENKESNTNFGVSKLFL